jgi:hypothetical protein
MRGPKAKRNALQEAHWFEDPEAGILFDIIFGAPSRVKVDPINPEWVTSPFEFV